MFKGVISTSKTQKTALTAVFLAAALVIGYLETLLPPILPVLPYAKLGVSNIFLLLCFLTVGAGSGIIAMLIKCLLIVVFSANFASLAWSLPAGVAAYAIMILLYKTKIFSVAGVSVAGGMAHNFMQILVASLIIGKSVFVFLPYMLLFGGLAGLGTGIICHILYKVYKNKIDKSFKLENEVYKRAQDL